MPPLLLEQRLTDLRVEQAYLAGQARDLLAFVRQSMSEAVATNPDRAWQHLSIEERATTETNLVVAGSSTSMEELQKNGEFLLHVPATFLPRLAEEWPDAFFDGKVFRGGYATVTTAASRELPTLTETFEAAFTVHATEVAVECLPSRRPAQVGPACSLLGILLQLDRRA